ncbi:LolA family protein, partial [Paenibacillus chitinolyticus]|nr:outer membrane lipoprotein carrier protein LolA [Paenibacillus chitinolyticus]
MRRVTWILAIVMSAALLLAGCGKKDAGSVVKDLDHVIGKLESYQGTGRMVLQTGQEPQEYQVEVWYQQPHYYRISLTNEKKDITQVVLRNDDGVFVLTPHLHKSFRFQSDWPENQGQVYLFQSLAQSILLDTERQFTKEGNSFVFDVAANYANSGQMARQKIWLDQKSLAPQKVEVSDSSSNVLVKLDFTQFEFGKKLEKDSFDMQRNMTSWDLKSLDKDAPVSGAATEPSAGAASPDGKAPAAGKDTPASAQAGAAGKDAAAGTPASGASAGAAADGGKA